MPSIEIQVMDKIKNWIQISPFADINCGNRAAKNKIALGFDADVKKPCKNNFL